jgi:hypothetical protein
MGPLGKLDIIVLPFFPFGDGLGVDEVVDIYCDALAVVVRGSHLGSDTMALVVGAFD